MGARVGRLGPSKEFKITVQGIVGSMPCASSGYFPSSDSQPCAPSHHARQCARNQNHQHQMQQDEPDNADHNNEMDTACDIVATERSVRRIAVLASKAQVPKLLPTPSIRHTDIGQALHSIVFVHRWRNRNRAASCASTQNLVWPERQQGAAKMSRDQTIADIENPFPISSHMQARCHAMAPPSQPPRVAQAGKRKANSGDAL